MKLKTKLFILSSSIFIIVSAVFWMYSKYITDIINESWGERFIQKQIVFDKYRTLTPIIREIKVVQRMVNEPDLIAMAMDENDPIKRQKGLEVLERYRLIFEDRSYFAAFAQSGHYYYNDKFNTYENRQLQYTLSAKNDNDRWFYTTMRSIDSIGVNVDKDNVLGVTKVWLNGLLKNDGKTVGVIGTGFDFEQFVSESVALEQDGVRNYFVDRQLAIQLAKDVSSIDYASITKQNDEHKTIHHLFQNQKEVKSVLTAMDNAFHARRSDAIETLWCTIDGKQQLVGIAYLDEIGWFSITIIDADQLMIVNNLYIFVVMSLLLLSILIIMNRIHDRFLLKPLSRLKEVMGRIEQGDKGVELSIIGTGEIAELSLQFNRMIEYVRLNSDELEKVILERTAGLVQSEHKLNTILDSVEAFIYIKDDSYKYTYVNKKTSHYFSKNIEEIIGCDDYSFFDQVTADQIRDNDRIVLEQGEKLTKEEVNTNLNGMITTAFLSTKIPLTRDDGTIFGICGISTDITERKRFECEIMESERKFRTLFDSTRDAVMLLDEKGFFECNRSTLEMFECPDFETFYTFHPAELSPSTQPSGGESMRLANEHIANAMKNGSEYFEWMHKRYKSGENFYAEVSLSAMQLGDRTVLQALVRDISRRKEDEAMIHNLAYYDPLTQLCNRRLFDEKIQHAIDVCKRSGEYCSVFFLDLDNFKPLNDRYGHDIGDLLLIETAARIKKSVRESDAVARFGGDEFVVLLEKLGSDESVALDNIRFVSEKIRRTLSQTFVLNKNGQTIQHHCTVSIGAVLFNARHSCKEEIIKYADLSMYSAKEQGKNRITILSLSDDVCSGSIGED